MAHKRTRSLAAYRRAQRRDWLLSTLTEIAALEGRLGLLTEADQAAFYGPEYLAPDEKLGRLLDTAATVGV